MQITGALERQQYRYKANDNCNSLSCGIFQAVPRSIVMCMYLGMVASGVHWSFNRACTIYIIQIHTLLHNGTFLKRGKHCTRRLMKFDKVIACQVMTL